MAFVFPMFRRYSNRRNYYRINSTDNFDELLIIGNQYVYSNFQANILPEFQLVVDLIENADQRWEPITEKDFEEKLAECQATKTEKKLI